MNNCNEANRFPRHVKWGEMKGVYMFQHHVMWRDAKEKGFSGMNLNEVRTDSN